MTDDVKNKKRKHKPRTEEQKQHYREAASRRKFKNNRPPGTYHHSEKTKFQIIESNLKTWSTLPEAWRKSCIENEAWFDKLRNVERKERTEEHIRNLIESKVGMTFEEWQVVRGELNSYAAKVRTVTEKQPLHQLANFDLRGNGYDLDHKFSIAEGFAQGISPEIIGDFSNLEFLPSRENQSKNKKCSVSKEQLLENYNARSRE